MDKKMDFGRGNPQEEAPKRIEKKDRRRWLYLGGVVLGIMLIVLAAVLWDSTAFDGLRRAVLYASAEKDETGCAKLYTYASEKDGCYASLGGSLIQATPRRILVLGEDGEARYNADVKFTRSAVCSNGEVAAVYDLGGTDIYVLSDRGLVRQLTAEGTILSCTINEKGMLAVTTNKSGYKAAVTVYDEAGEKAFAFNSSDRFLMTAAVSRDGRQMAAVTLGQSEGVFASNLVIYGLASTEPLADSRLTGSAVYDVGVVGKRWCAVGEDGLHFLVTGGEEAAYYDFEGTYLRRCSLEGEGFAALLLGRYKSGTQTQLVTVDEEGAQLAILDVDKEVLSLSAAGKYVAVLYSDELAIYDRNLEVCARLEDMSSAKLVLMRADGSAVLVGADAASLYLP